MPALKDHFATLKCEIQSLSSELEAVTNSRDYREDASDKSATSLQSQIDGLREELVSKSADASRMPGKIHNAQIPLWILPIEIIVEIFLLAIVDRYADEWIGTRARLSPLLAVCSSWNEIALQSPRLWSTISFNTHMPLEILSLQLARSKSVRLHLFIRDMDVAPSPEPSHIWQEHLRKIAEIFSLVAPHSDRCHTLGVLFSSKESAQVVSPLPGHFASLRSLKLWFYHDVEFSILPTGFDAGALEEIDACLRGRPLSGLLNLVAHCNSLQSLTICPFVPCFEARRPVELSLPNLRSLIVTNRSIMKLTSTWKLPRLTHLALIPDMDGFCTEPFCFPTLRTLALQGYSEGESLIDFIFNILRNHPRLITIEISSTPPSISIRALGALSSAPEICPRLAHVRLLARKKTFHEIEPAAHVLVERRPHIRMTIGVHDMPNAEPQTAPYNFRDSHPVNVTVLRDGYQYIFPRTLLAEHDIEEVGTI